MQAIFLLTSKNSVSYLYEDNTLRQGLEKMKAHGYTAIPVLSRDGSYIGCISEGDFLWHILDSQQGRMKDQEKYHIPDIIREGFNPAVRIDISMDALLERAIEQNFVPVVDDRNKFIGIITRKAILQYFINQNRSSPTDNGKEV